MKAKLYSEEENYNTFRKELRELFDSNMEWYYPQLIVDALQDCPDCNGNGNVTHSDLYGWHRVECKSCAGTGIGGAKPKSKGCTCGAEKCNSVSHSDWCDIEGELDL